MAHITLYDTTLRDGAQTQGVDFSVADKLAIAKELDALGIDYIEGGWPGANPTDDAFFEAPPALTHARFTAFGMTKRHGRSAANDPALNALLNTAAPSICLVGKAWDYQVETALGLTKSENLALIDDSIRHSVTHNKQLIFDAEHFFDGYKSNPEYALECIKTAYQAGARWITLCDTNGGTLPFEIEEIVNAVTPHIVGENLGIHCHNDTENAVANSLAAVKAGVRLVQGTLNGLGERCGNANLTAIIPTLMLKMGYTTSVTLQTLERLTHISRILDDRLNRPSNRHAAYVGEAAFAHKGGLHVSAVAKDPSSYEHINPDVVGNRRHVIVSDQSGRANILSRLTDIGMKVEPTNPKIQELLETLKQREFEGYVYDGAEASFALLAQRHLLGVPEFYTLKSFRVVDERVSQANGTLQTLSQATVEVLVNDKTYTETATGNGPVNALDSALRRVLIPTFPALERVRLVDYKVRILTPNRGTEALTRVLIESRDTTTGESWVTVGVSPNVIDASYTALQESIVYRLLHIF